MDVLDLACELVRFPSVSRVSNGPITDFLQQRLEEMGFEIERCDYRDAAGVLKSNLAGKLGEGSGGIAFFVHTDVVPADVWFRDSPGPFEPTVEGDRLYGRGSCDMKGSVAAVLAAASRFAGADLTAPLYIVCTADEEIGYTGALDVVAHSKHYQEMVQGGTRAVIAEPTSLKVVHSHKGTHGFRATSHGRAAHSSTRDGINANLAMIPYLVEMKAIYDETESDPAWHNDAFNPPTISWNICMGDGGSALNVTARESVTTVSFRPMPGQETDRLIERARRKAFECGLDFEAPFQFDPLYVDPDSPFIREMLTLTGTDRSRTVCYGTDGAVLHDLKEKVVVGPGDVAQAHTVDEWIALEQLERGTDVFTRIMRHYCCE
ncbi:MAG: M20 family metallopeptidase [Pirellulales bacterium]